MIAGVIAAIACCVAVLGYAIWYDGDQRARVDATTRSIERQCGSAARIYDVQDQDKVVYACADGQLRVRTYGHAWMP